VQKPRTGETPVPLIPKEQTMSVHRFIALLLAAVVVSPAGAEDPKPAAYTLSGPITCLNLAVYLVHGDSALPGGNYLTLQEALEKKKIVVHETGNVGQLAVENVSKDVEVFLQAGDIVKGGRQDRVLAYDLLVPPRSGRVPIDSFCVEANRWRQRGNEDAERFSSSSGQLPGKGLRLAVSSARQQAQVWQKVKEQQDRLSKTLKRDLADPKSPSSLQLTLEDKELQAQMDRYVRKLENATAGKKDVIGFVLAINGKVDSAEIYASSALMQKMWPKMLRAAAVDALSDLLPGKKFEPAELEGVRTFLADRMPDLQDSKTTKVNDRFVLTVRTGATRVSVETREVGERGALLHRSVIAK
jgi:hypothetical protein